MEQREDPPELYTIGDVMRISKASRSTVKRWVRTGQLRTLKLGRLRRFRPEDLLAYLDARVDTWEELRARAAR